jgi:hypothetical protein
VAQPRFWQLCKDAVCHGDDDDGDERDVVQIQVALGQDNVSTSGGSWHGRMPCRNLVSATLHWDTKVLFPFFVRLPWAFSLKSDVPSVVFLCIVAYGSQAGRMYSPCRFASWHLFSQRME